ncbi:hypothetical protein [Phytopseudomonas seleniipraecipitans]|uniref:Uncharacterized protein n=1 Tax=Phytopseudomonas seleniipraecipitans TaxID=640205 RepID=A0A1G7JBQ1_9GAMM|nr:hypothetical protein [Pseudomonas seleniipraecipitans]SDF22313.1 hypothetical protein SAMN05216381_1059 [Pseudomonas seleniipraecipitans]
MADAVLYTHLQPGAPALGLGIKGSAVIDNNGVVGFFNLLIPCLVTGYGTGATAKPGQGWTLVRSELPQHFTIKSPDGVFYSFGRGPNQNQYPYANMCQLFLSENVTDASVFPPQGTNVRSYAHSVDYSSSNSRHWMCPSHYYAITPGNWFLIARGSQVFFISNWNENSAGGMGGYGDNPLTSAANYGCMYFFGNFTFPDALIPKSGPQNHMALGGNYRENTWPPSSESDTYLLQYGTRLRNPLTGAVETAVMPTVQSYCSLKTGYGGAKLGIPAYAPDMSLTVQDVYDPVLGFFATLPGIFRDEFYSHRSAQEVSRALGKGGTLAECLEPFDFNGDPIYLVPTPYGTAFFCLKEKYWNA